MDGDKGRANADQVQQSLKGVSYPASKDDLVANAKSQGAGEDVIAVIMSLDTDNFSSSNDVMNAMNRSQGQGGQGQQGQGQNR